VGPDHVDFKLNKQGDRIILADPTGNEINRVTFGAQLQGVSQGRYPDGSATIVNFAGSASPGASNYVVSYSGPIINEVLAEMCAPSPIGMARAAVGSSSITPERTRSTFRISD